MRRAEYSDIGRLKWLIYSFYAKRVTLISTTDTRFGSSRQQSLVMRTLGFYTFQNTIW